MRGQATLSERGIAGVFREPKRARAPKPAPVEPAPPLTRRQYEVLAHLARGLSYREIAAALGISPRTVRRNRDDLARRLGLSGQLCVIRYATTGRCAVLLTELSARYGAYPPS